MKNLELIRLENEYQYNASWARNYTKLIGHTNPNNFEKMLNVYMNRSKDKETVEILKAYKELGCEVSTYPFYREGMIRQNFLSEREVSKLDDTSRSYGYPVSTEKELETSQEDLLAQMIVSKDKFLNMNENDSLYNIYVMKNGENLSNQIKISERYMNSQLEEVETPTSSATEQEG